MPNARALLEVTAGLIPGQPIPELTKTWAITSDEWAAAQDTPHSEYSPSPQADLLATKVGAAQGYATLLMLQPSQYNWVRLDWIWL